MATGIAALEQRFFRGLNAVVEPAVRRGIASHAFLPAALIVLESIGFKSGRRRRTPLMSVAAGPYRVVATVRSERSFWVKNLRREPQVDYFLGGRSRAAEAVIVAEGAVHAATDMGERPVLLRHLLQFLMARSRSGMTFAILVPSGEP